MSGATSSITPNGIAESMSPVKQLSVFLHNQVGALLSLVKLLNEHDIEVLGFSIQDSIELTLIRLVVTDPDSAKNIFDEHGISCASKPIVVVELGGAHELCHVLAALLAAEINIHHAYPLMVQPNRKSILALYADDTEIGGECLAKAGFKVLSQDELSR